MSTKSNKNIGNQENTEQKSIKDIVVGYVMPIAKTEGYPDTHWNDVMSILDATVQGLGIGKGRIVSDGGEITTIHSRIVNNLNEDDIVICDVSSRNPNVMFELGMRIAFDKPVIIIKDDVTDYCFDSGTIEHVGYPKDLRHGLINKFQHKLAEKITATFNAYIKDGSTSVSPILKNFGSFDKRDIQLNELSANEALVQDIQSIKNSLVRLQMSSQVTSTSKFVKTFDGKLSNYLVRWSGNNATVNLKNFNSMQLASLINWVDKKGSDYVLENDSAELNIHVNSKASHEELLDQVNKILNYD